MLQNRRIASSPIGSTELPAISPHRVQKVADGLTYYALSEEDGKGLVGTLALADSVSKLKQVGVGEQTLFGEKSTFVDVQLVADGGSPSGVTALVESALSEGVGILVEQTGPDTLRIHKTRDIGLASDITTEVANSAVAIEPANGWVKPQFWNKSTITIAAAVGGIAVVGIIGFYLMERRRA